MTVDRAETWNGASTQGMLLDLPEMCIVKLTDKNMALKCLVRNQCLG
jgi:hypothetical protein